VFLPAGTALVLFVLCFYHGSLGGRQALAFAIVMITVALGAVVQWLQRRQMAGSFSLALRLPRPFMIILGFFFAAFIIVDIMSVLITRTSFAYVGIQLGQMVVWICLFLMLVVGTELRKRGCVTFFKFMPWEEIVSHEWRPTRFKDLLFLQLNLRNGPVPLQQRVHAANKDKVERILIQYVPQATEADSDRSKELGVSEPKHGWFLFWLFMALGSVLTGMTEAYKISSLTRPSLIALRRRAKSQTGGRVGVSRPFADAARSGRRGGLKGRGARAAG
jgi:hypothetical protein